MKRVNDIAAAKSDSADIRDRALGAALRRAVGCLADADEAALKDMAERVAAADVAGDRSGVPGSRDALKLSGGVSAPRFLRSLRRLPAAAAVIVGVGAAGAGVGIGLSGRADARANAFQVASAILPEYSRWVPEAIVGAADPAGPVAEFVESLWSSGSSADGPFGPVY